MSEIIYRELISYFPFEGRRLVLTDIPVSQRIGGGIVYLTHFILSKKKINSSNHGLALNLMKQSIIE